MDLGIAKFRIAKFSHCEIGIGNANLKFALRNGIWHCEISHCEIFALRNWNWHCEIDFGIAKLALRNFRIANLALRNFRIANLALRTAQYPAATVPLVLHPAACILLQLHLIFFTLPWFFF